MSGVLEREALLESVTVRAEAGASIGVLSAPGAAKAAARAELGLPTDRPIVMVGHQAEVWHAGILAKLIAAAEIAKAHNAALVWLTPDQDANEPTMLPYPAVTHEGRLKRREWLIDPNAFVRPGTPTGSRLAMEPGAVPRVARTEWPHEAVRDGLNRVHRSLVQWQGEASLAAQFTRAALDMVRESLGISVDHVLMCSAMSRGAAFGMWAERMHREARGCVLAYNAAAQAHPEAQVRDLEMGPRWELPLWSLTPERPRAAVYGDAPLPARVAPRALAMTGFVRTLLCDAWVMGVGGEQYDAVTRQWLRAWMGKADLSPGVIATATLRAPLRDGALPDPKKAAEAAWRVHHARHHPAMLGQEDRQRERDAIVERMESSPRGSIERRTLFARLREVLHEARDAGEAKLSELRDEAQAEHERLRDMDCVLDRTWPFALHPDAMLKELDARVRSAAGALA
ncbi:MAG: hypothetical protein ACIAQU_10415 [Phycisphaerales bacterium JB064]